MEHSREKDVLSEDRWSRFRTSQFHYLSKLNDTGNRNVKKTHFAPNMTCMFIDKGSGRVSDQQLRDDQQSNAFLAVQGLLEDMAAIAVCSEFDDAASRIGKRE